MVNVGLTKGSEVQTLRVGREQHVAPIPVTVASTKHNHSAMGSEDPMKQELRTFFNRKS